MPACCLSQAKEKISLVCQHLKVHGKWLVRQHRSSQSMYHVHYTGTSTAWGELAHTICIRLNIHVHVPFSQMLDFDCGFGFTTILLWVSNGGFRCGLWRETIQTKRGESPLASSHIKECECHVKSLNPQFEKITLCHDVQLWLLQFSPNDWNHDY
jgi:hypothetical protein